MKRILATTAVFALALGMSAPAHAQLQLGIAGHFKGYVDWTNQDTNTGRAPRKNETALIAGNENLAGVPAGAVVGGNFVRGNEAETARSFDIIRDTEVHFTGETTLDNGLTVGVHVEAMADAGDAFAVDESYAYFSGAWGRFNLGDEDGAAYLLQVAAPSADSNVDGIRQYVNPVNYGVTVLSGQAALLGGALDYANDATRHEDKLTYLTPVFSGFQAGISYTPQTGAQANFSRTFGNSIKNAGNDSAGSAWEGAARWEGTFDNVGINLGGGYTWQQIQDRVSVVAPVVGADNFKEWNLGADVNVSAFGLGVIYTQNNEAVTGSFDNKTWVLGGDYTTGPFKLGASWLNNKAEGASPGVNLTTGVPGDVKTNRYSAGVVYTFAPGMSFRGSVGMVKSSSGGDIGPVGGTHNSINGVPDVKADYALLGTQINF